MFAGVEFAHEADHQQNQTHPEGVHRIAVAGVVVEEGIAAGLIDCVEQGVPVEHGEHETRQSVGDEHLAGCDHVGALVNCGEDADRRREPRLDREQDEAEDGAREPCKYKHKERHHRLLNLQRREGHVVDKEDHAERQNLNIERAEGGGANRDDCVHGRVLHHRAGGSF